MIANHYASKLSDLDMQIISFVPPGGNWKNIPESVPSQRLAQIRESYKEGKGSRSTYYGRLKTEMPSYTINTYFNRPGNGCHIHYEQDRTLSQREAARLQSFPDDFIFEGSRTAVYNQIGNAVPPLLAYQIAERISFKGQFVDLFCGAGGLALGFIWSGWKPIIANDIDINAINTHIKNIGELAIVGDINDEEIIHQIVSKCEEAKAENPHLPLFVLGGPPCQGFSTANTRRGVEDQRNWLFKAYAKVLERIKPDGFVFENVTGIINLEKGKFFEIIKKELGRSVETLKVNKVNSVEYGIPQRRERVIVIGGEKSWVDTFQMHPITQLMKAADLEFLPKAISVKDALSDLPHLEPAEDGSEKDYISCPVNDYQRFMRGKLAAGEYIRSLNP
jgi:DNA (cytosine-5)-methyltransferase 1